MLINSNLLVKLQNVSVNLGGQKILSKISAQIQVGEFIGVVGPNGAGKTTLIKTILNELTFSGYIEKKPNLKLGYVPQKLAVPSDWPITVLELFQANNTHFPLWVGRPQNIKKLALELLYQTSSDKLIHQPLSKLSGGELQRVLLALALHPKPDLLILDEPVSGVDFVGGEQLCCLLSKLAAQGMAVLMINHDISVVQAHCHTVWCLNRELKAVGPPDVCLTGENLQLTYNAHISLHLHKSHTDGDNRCSQ